MAARAFAHPARRLCTSARTSDVIVVGAGIMGLNIAYQLRRRDPNLSIRVLERAASLGAGSTGVNATPQVHMRVDDDHVARARRLFDRLRSRILFV